jgi:RNA polymerase sigma-70 factor, ECF subfamily
MDAPLDGSLDALIGRLADGDRSAFTPAFKILWPRTLRLCSSMLKNEADAADAAQQAMEKVLTRCADYDPARPAMPWALAIAAWECRTIAKRRSRRREEPEEAAPERTSGETEEVLIQRDLTRAALDAMGHLAQLDRETLLSTFANELAGASAAALRKRRQRALERLRNLFKGLYGIDQPD